MTKVQDEAMTRLDSAVSGVFELMLARSCDPMEGEVDTVEGRIVARIQFTGGVDGECLLYASPATASVTAEALLGTPSEPHDPMVDDAIGELCNMIAGNFKAKVSTLGEHCLLSVPTVISGADYSMGIAEPSKSMIVALTLADESIWVALIVHQ